jgi:purine-binding chemotaxis protein CheW
VKTVAGQLTSEAAAAQLTPGQTAQWVVFSLEGSRYALPLARVDRIVRAVQVTPLPLAPAVVLGVIDVAGEVLPVFDLRHKFRLPQRPIQLADQFLIARTRQRLVVLVIDAAHGVLEGPSSAIPDTAHIAPTHSQVRGVISHEDGLVLIHDLEKFLSADEARVLDAAMNQDNAHAN